MPSPTASTLLSRLDPVPCDSLTAALLIDTIGSMDQSSLLAVLPSNFHISSPWITDEDLDLSPFFLRVLVYLASVLYSSSACASGTPETSSLESDLRVWALKTPLMNISSQAGSRRSACIALQLLGRDFIFRSGLAEHASQFYGQAEAVCWGIATQNGPEPTEIDRRSQLLFGMEPCNLLTCVQVTGHDLDRTQVCLHTGRLE